MNFRQLQYFCAVFEHGSISRAAAALGIRQSTLSTSLKRLETELDVPLFVHARNRCQPTKAGGEFYESVKRSLREFDLLKASLLTGEASGHPFRLGTDDMVFPTEALAPFFADGLQVSCAAADQLMAGLRDGTLDAVMASGNIQSGSCTIRELCHLPLRAWLRDGPAAAAGDEIPGAMLSTRPLFVSRQEECVLKPLLPDVPVTPVVSPALLYRIVEKGLGTVLSVYPPEAGHDAIRAIPVAGSGRSQPICLYMAEGAQELPGEFLTALFSLLC